jgi:hypothetical protein
MKSWNGVTGVDENVDTVESGDVGTVCIYSTCHECEMCLAGRENLCDNLKRVGFEFGLQLKRLVDIHVLAAFTHCCVIVNLLAGFGQRDFQLHTTDQTGFFVQKRYKVAVNVTDPDKIDNSV